MTVQHKLPRLSPAYCKPQPVHYIVQSPFQKHKQILTGDAGHTQSPFKEQEELLFLHPIDTPKFLFFSKLQPIIRPFTWPSLGILAGSGPLFINRTFIALTPAAFKHELFLFRPA
jgi:hypothetical protein